MGEVDYMPCLVQPRGAAVGGLVKLGHPLLDAYVELVMARARWNTVLATAFDLKVVFSVVAKDPVDITPAGVLAFIEAQPRPRRRPNVARIEHSPSALAPTEYLAVDYSRSPSSGCEKALIERSGSGGVPPRRRFQFYVNLVDLLPQARL